MRTRFSISLFGLLAATVAAGLVSTAHAQVTPREQPWDPDYEPPRNEFGQPDLQGNWTNATLTPLERRPGQEPVYTWAEYDAIRDREQQRFVEGAQPSDPNRPPPEPGNIGAYNQVYFDRGDAPAIVDGEPRASLITFPDNGRLPPLSPDGQRRKEAYDAFRAQFGEYDHPELRPLVDRCIVYYASSRTGTMGPPMTPTGGYNNNFQIVQNGDHVLIRSEMIHDVRIIRLGEPDRLPPEVRPWFGDSWGRWEGNTLVVETTNMHPHHGPREQTDHILQSPEARAIERFTLLDENNMLYEFEIHDPNTYTEVWGGQVPWRRYDDRLYEYACHEGNYALSGILRGARYQEERSASGGRRQ